MSNVFPTQGIIPPLSPDPARADTVQADCQRVRQLRQRAGLTQKDLALKAGYAQKTIENIEKGLRVQRATLENVAEALGATADDLLAQSVQGPHSPALLGLAGRSTLAPAPRCSVLVVDDEPSLLPLFTRMLSPEFEVLTASNADEAEAVFRRRPVDLILTDQKMPRRTGVELLEWVRAHHPRTVRMLMTGNDDLEAAIAAINRSEVYHYLPKPWKDGAVVQVLRNAAEKFALERARDELLEELRQSNHELEEANRQLRERTLELECEAFTDPLTGLHNRRAIIELANVEVRRHNRYPNPLSVGLLKVDHSDLFRTDPLRARTEDALEKLARLLGRTVRKGDSIGRLHGDEFLLIARETDEEGVGGLARRIQGAIAATGFEHDRGVVSLTVSICFVVADRGVPTTIEAITRVLAEALDSARKAGGNTCVIYRLSPSGPEDRDEAAKRSSASACGGEE